MPTFPSDRENNRAHTTLPDIFRTIRGDNLGIGPQSRIRDAGTKENKAQWGRGVEPQIAPASYPRIVLRDALGYELDTYTTLQEAIYRAKWNVKQTGQAKTPIEWRLPKAPPPARPDLTRTCPPGKHPAPETEADKQRKKQPYTNILEFDVDDVGFVKESLQCLPYVPSLSFLRQEFLCGPKMYFQIVGTMLLHERFLSLTEKRNAVYNFPGFCAGCTRMGLCYGCEKGTEPHYHEDKPVKTGGGFTYYKKDRPEKEIRGKNPAHWRIHHPDHALKQLMEEYAGVDLEGEVPEEVKKHLDKYGGHREHRISHIPDFAAEMNQLNRTDGDTESFLPDIVNPTDLNGHHGNNNDPVLGDHGSRSYGNNQDEGSRTDESDIEKYEMIRDQGLGQGQPEDSDYSYRDSQRRHGNKRRTRSEEAKSRKDYINIAVAKRVSSNERGGHLPKIKKEDNNSDKNQLEEDSSEEDGEEGSGRGRSSKRKGNLYKPPPTFKLKKSPNRRIQSKSPFSSERNFNLNHGSGFQVKKSDKAPTKFKDFRNVDVSWKEPKKFELKESNSKTTKFWSGPRKNKDDSNNKKHRRRSPGAGHGRSRQRASPTPRSITPDSGHDSENMTDVKVKKKQPGRSSRQSRKITQNQESGSSEEAMSRLLTNQTALDDYSDTATEYYKNAVEVDVNRAEAQYHRQQSLRKDRERILAGLPPLNDSEEARHSRRKKEASSQTMAVYQPRSEAISPIIYEGYNSRRPISEDSESDENLDQKARQAKRIQHCKQREGNNARQRDRSNTRLRDGNHSRQRDPNLARQIDESHTRLRDGNYYRQRDRSHSRLRNGNDSRQRDRSYSRQIDENRSRQRGRSHSRRRDRNHSREKDQNHSRQGNEIIQTVKNHDNDKNSSKNLGKFYSQNNEQLLVPANTPRQTKYVYKPTFESDLNRMKSILSRESSQLERKDTVNDGIQKESTNLSGIEMKQQHSYPKQNKFDNKMTNDNNVTGSIKKYHGDRIQLADDSISKYESSETESGTESEYSNSDIENEIQIRKHETSSNKVEHPANNKRNDSNTRNKKERYDNARRINKDSVHRGYKLSTGASEDDQDSDAISFEGRHTQLENKVQSDDIQNKQNRKVSRYPTDEIEKARKTKSKTYSRFPALQLTNQVDNVHLYNNKNLTDGEYEKEEIDDDSGIKSARDTSEHYKKTHNKTPKRKYTLTELERYIKLPNINQKTNNFVDCNSDSSESEISLTDSETDLSDGQCEITDEEIPIKVSVELNSGLNDKQKNTNKIRINSRKQKYNDNVRGQNNVDRKSKIRPKRRIEHPLEQVGVMGQKTHILPKIYHRQSDQNDKQSEKVYSEFDQKQDKVGKKYRRKRGSIDHNIESYNEVFKRHPQFREEEWIKIFRKRSSQPENDNQEDNKEHNVNGKHLVERTEKDREKRHKCDQEKLDENSFSETEYETEINSSTTTPLMMAPSDKYNGLIKDVLKENDNYSKSKKDRRHKKRTRIGYNETVNLHNDSFDQHKSQTARTPSHEDSFDHTTVSDDPFLSASLAQNENDTHSKRRKCKKRRKRPRNELDESVLLYCENSDQNSNDNINNNMQIHKFRAENTVLNPETLSLPTSENDYDTIGENLAGDPQYKRRKMKRYRQRKHNRLNVNLDGSYSDTNQNTDILDGDGDTDDIKCQGDSDPVTLPQNKRVEQIKRQEKRLSTKERKKKGSDRIHSDAEKEQRDKIHSQHKKQTQKLHDNDNILSDNTYQSSNADDYENTDTQSLGNKERFGRNNNENKRKIKIRKGPRKKNTENEDKHYDNEQSSDPELYSRKAVAKAEKINAAFESNSASVYDSSDNEIYFDSKHPTNQLSNQDCIYPVRKSASKRREKSNDIETSPTKTNDNSFNQNIKERLVNMQEASNSHVLSDDLNMYPNETIKFHQGKSSRKRHKKPKATDKLKPRLNHHITSSERKGNALSDDEQNDNVISDRKNNTHSLKSQLDSNIKKNARKCTKKKGVNAGYGSESEFEENIADAEQNSCTISGIRDDELFYSNSFISGMESDDQGNTRYGQQDYLDDDVDENGDPDYISHDEEQAQKRKQALRHQLRQRRLQAYQQHQQRLRENYNEDDTNETNGIDPHYLDDYLAYMDSQDREQTQMSLHDSVDVDNLPFNSETEERYQFLTSENDVHDSEHDIYGDDKGNFQQRNEGNLNKSTDGCEENSLKNKLSKLSSKDFRTLNKRKQHMNQLLTNQNTQQTNAQEKGSSEKTEDDSVLHITVPSCEKLCTSPPYIPSDIDLDKGSLTSFEPELDLVFDDVIDVDNIEVVDNDDEENEEKLKAEERRRRRHRYKRRKRREAEKAKEAAMKRGEEEIHSEKYNDALNKDTSIANENNNYSLAQQGREDSELDHHTIEQVLNENKPSGNSFGENENDFNTDSEEDVDSEFEEELDRLMDRDCETRYTNRGSRQKNRRNKTKDKKSQERKSKDRSKDKQSERSIERSKKGRKPRDIDQNRGNSRSRSSKGRASKSRNRGHSNETGEKYGDKHVKVEKLKSRKNNRGEVNDYRDDDENEVEDFSQSDEEGLEPGIHKMNEMGETFGEPDGNENEIDHEKHSEHRQNENTGPEIKTALLDKRNKHKKRRKVKRKGDEEVDLEKLPTIQTQVSKILKGMPALKPDKRNSKTRDQLVNELFDKIDPETGTFTNTDVKNMEPEEKWELVRPKSAQLGEITDGVERATLGYSGMRARSMSMPLLTDIEEMMSQMDPEALAKLKEPLLVPIYLPSFKGHKPKKQFRANPQRVKGRDRSMSVSVIATPFSDFGDSTIKSELEPLQEEPIIPTPSPSPPPKQEPEPIPITKIMADAAPTPLFLQPQTPAPEPPKTPPKRKEIVKKEKKEKPKPTKPPTPVREPTPSPSPPPEEPPVTSREISFVFEKEPSAVELPPIEIPSLPDMPTPRVAPKQKVKKELKLIEVTPQLAEEKKKLPPPPKLGPKIRPYTLRKSKVAEAPVTPQELQQLSDPLDFLAKYCIINPDRLPFYERIFNGAVSVQTPRYMRNEPPVPGKMVQLPPAVLSEHELNMLRDLTVLNHAQTPRREGMSAPEQYLEKLNYTVELVKSKQATIQDHMAKLQGEKIQIMAQLAKEMDRDIARVDYKVKGKAKKKEDSKKKKKKKVDVVDYDKMGAMSVNAKDFKPTRASDITDEVIVSRMNDKMMKKVKKDPIVKTLSLEISRDIEKMKHYDQRIAQIEDEKDLVGLYCMDYYFSEQGSSSRPKEFLRQQSRLYQKLHPDPDIEMNIEEVEMALQQINNKLLTEREFQYIFFILDLPKREKINFRLFSIIAALSEKVTQMDPMVRKLINKNDYNALDVKMEKSKELFDLMQDADLMPLGNAPSDNLAVELTAGGLTPEHTNYVLSKFDREGRGHCDFMDFVTYVPLFLQIHNRIISDPFNDNLDV